MTAPVTAPAPPFDESVRLGPQIGEDGVVFNLVCRHANRVWLMLFDSADAPHPDREVELLPHQHRFGDTWSIHVPEARVGQYYLYRISGRTENPHDPPFDPNQWLLDPRARAIAGSPTWGTKRGPQGKTPKNGPAFPKGVLVADTFDWEADARPRVPLKDTVLYETHVRGFTAGAGAHVAHPGTYRGLIEKIPYLKDLGITSIELMPVYEFNEMEYFESGDSRKHLRNFWGYSTLGFFAPNGRYAAAGVSGGQVNEFKALVKAMHAAGIEVILDVVYNHSCEGDANGPTLSFKGFDPSMYYMRNPDLGSYHNFSGCGNTMNVNHPVVQDFIIDSLRYWAVEMRVDGFRFDLASIFNRGLGGEVLQGYSIVDRITEDPILREMKLIAEPWDAANLYQVGHWPRSEWAEWNGKYRDDVRRFWLGHHGMLRALAARLVGSPDLYERRPKQSPVKSINFVTSHDGFSLHDLVSYNAKDNLANGEDNRDGSNENWSYNHGVEGATTNPEVLVRRMKKMKNFMATLMVSQGIPMLLAGDELARTQQGNNNAYAQDNEISWLDWSRLDRYADLHAFVKQCIALRANHPCLRQNRFINSHKRNDRPPDVRWTGPRGGEPHWDIARSVAMMIHGNTQPARGEQDTCDLLILFNAEDQDLNYHLPRPRGAAWKLDLFTQAKAPDPAGDRIEVERLSMCILTSQLR